MMGCKESGVTCPKATQRFGFPFLSFPRTLVSHVVLQYRCPTHPNDEHSALSLRNKWVETRTAALCSF